MAANNHIKRGDWNSVCAECGSWWKMGQLKLRWDHVMVCRFCYEERQPQDLTKGSWPERKIPWKSPDPNPIFLGTGNQQRTLDSYILDSITMG